ncbi:MAG: malate dehydrogenase, partial [Opitutales bacterium]
VCVCSKGEYGVAEGLITSFPIRSNGSDWEIVEGIELNEYAKGMIQVSIDELTSERDTVRGLGIL